MNELLVIARYNENVDWLKYSPVPHVVYNKGKQDLPDWIFSKSISNIGYEEYAYLSYIVENYDCLPDRIIFSQAEPFIHSPDFLQLLSCRHLFSDTQPLSYQYLDHDPPLFYKQQSFDYVNINQYKIHVEFINSILLRFQKIDNSFIQIRPGGTEVVYSLLSKDMGIDVRSGMLKLLDIPDRTFNDIRMTPMCYGAIFSVVKEKIQQKEKNYYKKLITISNHYNNNCANSLERKKFAWIMEMMWLELFQYEPPKELYTANPIGRWWNDV